MRLEIVFAAVVFVILLGMMTISLDYPPKARLFPLILIAITECLVVVHLIKEIRGKAGLREAAKEEGALEETNWTMYLRAPAWIGAFMLTIYLLGYLVGAALFSLIYLKVHGEKWFMAVSFALGVMVLVYGGFGIALKTPLYAGILFQ